MNATALLGASSAGAAWVFWVCAILAVLGALIMVTARKAVHSALGVAMTMINLAILYVSLQAPFLGMVQIIVYTGAVMMLFLFVVMLVGVDSSDSLVETIKGQRLAAILSDSVSSPSWPEPSGPVWACCPTATSTWPTPLRAATFRASVC